MHTLLWEIDFAIASVQVKKFQNESKIKIVCSLVSESATKQEKPSRRREEVMVNVRKFPSGLVRSMSW